MGTKLRLGCAMAAILLAACAATAIEPIAAPADLPPDGGSGRTEPFDPSPVPLERACETWALAQCRAEARCHEIPARYVDVCVDKLVAGECWYRFEPDVVEGHVLYDEAAWGRCLARLSDEAHCSSVLYPSAFLHQDADCRASFEGTLAPDEPCSDGWCASGWCDVTACPIRCVRQGQEGEACDKDWNCGYPFLCEDGRCRWAGNAGDRCTSDYPDYPSAECKSGLFCVNSRCTPPLRAGAACRKYGLPCDTGLRCDWRTQKCLAPPGPGEACDNAESEPCRHDLGCDLDRNVCVEGRGPGEPCVAGLTPWRTGCALVFQCVEESFRKGHCDRGPETGEPCQENSNLECAGSSCHQGVCVSSWQLPGYRCDDQHSCSSSGVCTDGFCVDAKCAGVP